MDPIIIFQQLFCSVSARVNIFCASVTGLLSSGYKSSEFNEVDICFWNQLKLWFEDK